MSAGKFTTRWGRMLTTRWGRDRQTGRHGYEAKLISRLRTLPGPTPEAGFKADLRTQLVAITERVVAESETEPAVASAAAPARRAARALRRPVLALTGAATVLVLLLGMAVWMSSGSLPGDSLYGVKRASENVQLSMAGGDAAKGQAYLELAGNRAREAAKLLAQSSALPGGSRPGAAGRISAHTASLVTDTLASADDDTIHGMQLLARAAVAQTSKDPLARMTTWWPGQNSRMTEVRNKIPDARLRSRAQASVALLQRIATRTGQLNSTIGCSCLARAVADELGPLPCTPCVPAPNRAPGGNSTTGTTLPVPVPGVGSTPSGALPSVSLPTLGGGPSTSRPPRAAGLPLVPPTASQLPSLPPAGPSGSVDPSGVGLPLPSPSVPDLPLPDLPLPDLPLPDLPLPDLPLPDLPLPTRPVPGLSAAPGLLEVLPPALGR